MVGLIRPVAALAVDVKDFNHGKPAMHLLRNPERVDGLQPATLDNFERLIRLINETR